MLGKDDSECVKKCMDFVVEGVRLLRGRPKRTWKEGSSGGDMKGLKLSKEDALVHGKLR